jgi:tetratricopeptide (TPR) repeat protein
MASYYTSFLASCWSRLTGREIKSALHEMNAELGNIRTAWNWAVSHHKTQEIEAALDSLWFFYDQGSRYHEGEQVFAKAVNALKISASEQRGLWAKVLAWHGALCRMALLRDASITLLEESVSFLRQSEARADLAFALARLSAVMPELSRREQCLQESLAIYTNLGDRWGIAEASNWLCMVSLEKGFQHEDHESFVRAQQYAQEELAASQQLDSLYGIARAYLIWGRVHIVWRNILRHSSIFRKV